MIKKLKQYYAEGELIKIIKFGLVGVSNTAVDFFVFWALTQWCGVNVYVAQTVAYSTATINSFILNSNWTFKSGRKYSFPEFRKFVLVNLASLGTSLLLMHLFNGIMGWDKMVAKVGIAFFTFAINYFGNRLWTFRKNN